MSLGIFGKLSKLGGTGIGVEVTPTGILCLDIALGIGGLPKGRMAELFGPESSGKTSVAMRIVAEVQRLGGTAVWIDADHSFNSWYAQNTGINIDELLISQPDDEETALEIVETFVKSGLADIIVVDPIAALVPKKEMTDSIEVSNSYLQSEMIADTIKRISGYIGKTNTVLLFLNQMRSGKGMSKEITPCGRAVRFYSTIRMEIAKLATIVSGNDHLGSTNKISVIKNKLSNAFTEAEFNILFDHGVSTENTIMDMALDLGIIKRQGAWFSYNGTMIGQGRKSVRQWLATDKDAAEEISKQILNNNRGGVLYAKHKQELI